jgi:hypothetical protein
VLIAIALAESGGHYGADDPKAINRNSNGSEDYGPWQINSVHRQYDKLRLLNDVTYNAGAALDLYHARGEKFTDWTVYNTGVYSAFLVPATFAWNNRDTASPLDPGDTTAAATTGLAQATGWAQLTKILGVLSSADFWKRAATILAGLAVLFFGFKAFVADGGTSKPNTSSRLPGR